MQDLLGNGPLVATSYQLGPRCYKVEPFKLAKQQCGEDVYGWKPSAERNSAAPWSTLLILGAEKVGEVARVYFVLSEDVTSLRETPFRAHKQFGGDRRLFVTSFQSFHDRVVNLYLPEDESVAEPTDERQKFIR